MMDMLKKDYFTHAVRDFPQGILNFLIKQNLQNSAI